MKQTRLFTILIVVASVVMLLAVVSQSIDTAVQNDEGFFDSILATGPQKPVQQTDERTNVLFLGISGESYIGGNLTDSIIFISLPHNTETTGIPFLLSIPKDLWVGQRKINSLYAEQGGTAKPDKTYTTQIVQTVEQMTNLPVHYVFVSTFDAMQQAVIQSGGVTIDEVLYDETNIRTYLRERTQLDGDFDRMLRHQKILLALLEKIPPVSDDSSSFDLITANTASAQYFSTNLTIGELYNFYTLVASVPYDMMASYMLDVETGFVQEDVRSDEWGLALVEGDAEYGMIQEFIDTIINQYGASQEIISSIPTR